MDKYTAWVIIIFLFFASLSFEQYWKFQTEMDVEIKKCEVMLSQEQTKRLELVKGISND
jgi:hypothetical protein